MVQGMDVMRFKADARMLEKLPGFELFLKKW